MIACIAAHLWQSTLLLLAAWMLALAFQHNSAAIRYWIWFAASMKFLVPLALLQRLGDYLGRSLPEPLLVAPALIDTANAVFVPSVRGLAAIPDTLLPQLPIVVATIWGFGAAALLLRWILQWRAIHSAVASAPRMAMGLPTPVRITAGALTPGVFGVFRPVVIVPRTVLRELGPGQLQALLAHEVCHIRRRDNLTAALHKCVELIFWFHPLVWWIGANLLREREAACDESVIESGHRQAVYAESILHVCRLGVTSKFSGVAASTGGNLAQRISSIMSEERARPIGHGRFALLFAAAILACYGPIAAGVVAGAIREVADSGPVTFDAITLKLSEHDGRRSSQPDPDAGRIALSNVSLRDLISLAYPASRVKGDPELIDRARYDIEARWHQQGGTNHRTLYRELLRNVLRTNSNLQVYVRNE